jgi:hypothetical protein
LTLQFGVQDYERVFRLNLEWQWERGNASHSFDVSASVEDIVGALQVTNRATLAQLPLVAPDIGRSDRLRRHHTRLVAHLAVALALSKGGKVDLNFDLPEHQDSPRSSTLHTKLVNKQLRSQLDTWLAALVEAAGNSSVPQIVCSSYVLQAAARHELRSVLSFKRLAYQQPMFKQAPKVELRVNTDACALAQDTLWRGLRNIVVLNLHFDAGRNEQRRTLRTLPAGSIRCLTVSGCDAQAPGMLDAMCSALQRIRELEAFQLGPVAQVLAEIDEHPLSEAQMLRLSGCLRRPYRIISVEFCNKCIQDEVCSHSCSSCTGCWSTPQWPTLEQTSCRMRF